MADELSHNDMDAGPPASPTDPSPKITWNNRRKMAWVCILLNVAIFASCGFLPIDKINAAKDILVNLEYANVLIIATYMGSTAMPFLVSRK